MVVGALAAGGRQAVEHRHFGCSRSGTARTRVGALFSRELDLGIGHGLLPGRQRLYRIAFPDIVKMLRRYGRDVRPSPRSKVFVEAMQSRTNLPQLSARNLEALEAITRPDWYVDERLWSFLSAALIAEAPDRFVPLFCRESLRMPSGGCVVCEGEPISPRGAKEGNTMLDIAFGHIEPRKAPATPAGPGKSMLSGIGYGPKSSDSWVCFVEAKYLSDCACRTTYDPLRNQLARVIENLLCLQTEGQHPETLHFVLLTPRVFWDNPKSRMYGYKMADYRDPANIEADIDLCELQRRGSGGYKFPRVDERLKHLAAPRWVTFEDVLNQAGFGDHLDIVRRPQELDHIHSEIIRRLKLQRDAIVL